MFSVALIGADGAGKTTTGQQLLKDQTLPFKIKYIYMGLNPDASNITLPTTKLILRVKRALGKSADSGGPPDPARSKRRSKNMVKRIISGTKSSLRLVNLLGEEWFRQGTFWYYNFRGYVVLFDRHFFIDHYAHDIVNTEPHRAYTSRIHGFLLNRFYPRPDLVILLDAPAQILLDRKGEGTVELLERRRQEYWEIRDKVKHFEIVDSSQAQHVVTNQVITLIKGFYLTQAGSTAKFGDIRL